MPLSKTQTLAVAIAVGVLLLGGAIALWYYLSKPSKKSNEGDTCTTTGGKAGTLQNNICVDNPPTPRPTPTSQPVTIPFIAGQDVYLNLAEPQGSMGNNDRQGIPIYTYPYSDTNDYLAGLIKPSAYAGAIIGKFVSPATRGFSKITLSNLGIWQNSVPVYPWVNVSGDYFIQTSALKKTPY